MTNIPVSQIFQWIEQKQWTQAERALRPFPSTKIELDPERKRLHRRVRTELNRLCTQQIKNFEYLGGYPYTCGNVSYTVAEYEHLLTGMDFVLLPPQKTEFPFSFQMGSPETEPYRVPDEISHSVVFTHAFLVSKCVVTQKVWVEHMHENPSYFQRGELFPVEQVSWDDCQIFCKKTGLSLLTEAQWEYSARGGSSTAYCFGDSIKEDQALFRPPLLENERGPTSVATYPPNAFGLYEMHGNIYEWCIDWYGNYANWSVTDPIGPPYGLHRVYRGGSYLDTIASLRSASRSSFDPGYHRRNLGFRVCKNLNKS